MTLVLTLLLKSLLVFALAGALLLLLRRSSAAARSLVCLLTLGATLALPLFSLTLPGWHLPVLSAAAAPPLTKPITTAEFPPAPNNGGAKAANAETYSPPAGFPTVRPAPAPPLLGAGGTLFPWPLTCAAFYALGVMFAALRPLLGLWGIRRLSRGCIPVDGPQTLALADRCSSLLGLTLPRLSLTDVPVPMTWGWHRPVVVLPLCFAEWPEGRLRSVLLHEMAHIKRRDWPAHRLADLVCAVYWFHPLVWLTARRLRAESEVACDDLVLACGVPAPDYARHLLAIAQTLPPAAHSPHSAIAMAQTSRIERRLHMILDKSRSRCSLPRRAFLLGAVICATVLVPLAMLRPAAKAQTALAAPQPVQLLGIVDAVTPDGNEWSATGNTLPAPVFSNHWGPGSKITAQLGQKALFFVFHLPKSSQRIPVIYEVSGTTYGGFSMTRMGSSPGHRIALITETMQSIQMQLSDNKTVYGAAFPAALARTGIQVGVALGPWTETVDCPKTIGKVRQSRPAGDVIFTLIPNPHSFSPTQAVRGNAVFMVSDHFHSHTPLTADNAMQVTLHDGMNEDRAVYALDQAGQIIAKLAGTYHPGLDTDGSFKLEQLISIPKPLLKRIASFRLVTRPYQWTEFKNVALEPTKP